MTTRFIEATCVSCNSRTVNCRPSLRAVAVCSECRDHEGDRARIDAEQQSRRQASIDNAWRKKTPSWVMDIEVPDAVCTRLAEAAARTAPVIISGGSASQRTAALWYYGALLGQAGIPAAKAAVATEHESIADMTRASFQEYERIAATIRSPMLYAVLMDGVGEGQFLTADRRRGEWGSLASVATQSNQVVALSTTFTLADKDTSCFESGPLATHLGPQASRHLADLFARRNGVIIGR